MKIFDLTRDKYSQLITNNLRTSTERMLINLINKVHVDTIEAITSNPDLETIPVFIVESSMTGEYIAVPNCEYSVQVPYDKFKKNNEINTNNLLDLPNKESNGNVGESIYDLLGVYISQKDSNPIPHRIFIWIDKVVKSAKFDIDNADALLKQVILHEMSHAIMDVDLYGLQHNSAFTYAHPLYRFIEEAFANGLSIEMCWEEISTKQQKFIEGFVKKQGGGYSDGWSLFQQHHCTHNVDQWMWMKVMFDKIISHLLWKIFAQNGK